MLAGIAARAANTRGAIGRRDHNDTPLPDQSCRTAGPAKPTANPQIQRIFGAIGVRRTTYNMPAIIIMSADPCDRGGRRGEI
jgi:hypothetical protein